MLNYVKFLNHVAHPKFWGKLISLSETCALKMHVHMVYKTYYEIIGVIIICV